MTLHELALFVPTQPILSVQHIPRPNSQQLPIRGSFPSSEIRSSLNLLYLKLAIPNLIVVVLQKDPTTFIVCEIFLTLKL